MPTSKIGEMQSSDKYGKLPAVVGNYCLSEDVEMMFVQYLPIKLKGQFFFQLDERLSPFRRILYAAKLDYCVLYGIEEFENSYVYLTLKSMYQSPNNSFNREGWHSDGFLTNDINYIWSDKNPTIFCKGDFDLTLDDTISLDEMRQQAHSKETVEFNNGDLLRLDQFNIHKVGNCKQSGIRNFLKISISKDQYNLKGNAHNYKLNYKWDMIDRKIERNIPQQPNYDKSR